MSFRTAGVDDRPYRRIDGDLRLGLILLCDHAENWIPRRFDRLGLEPSVLQQHIAYDPGAASLTEGLARRLGAPALLTRFSRLLIDPNRGDDDPTQILEISDRMVIPGNVGLSEAARWARRDEFYEPYHRAIDGLIDEAMAAGRVPVLLSVHSFTPAWRGMPRPWHASVLWDKDDRLPVPLLAGLGADPSLTIGDNEPYSGVLLGDTLNRHGTQRGIAHALIEVRQDLLRTPSGQAEWAERIALILQHIFSDKAQAQALAQIVRYGSRADRPPGWQMPEAPGDFYDEQEETDMAPEAALRDEELRTALEADVFRRLQTHLMARTDVQNIDLMELAGFCRNCLANWYREAAEARGVALSKDEAREIIYGMAYEEWKNRFQR